MYRCRCSMQLQCLLSVFIIYSQISYTRVDSQKFLTQQKLYIHLWKQKRTIFITGLKLGVDLSQQSVFVMISINSCHNFHLVLCNSAALKQLRNIYLVSVHTGGSRINLYSSITVDFNKLAKLEHTVFSYMYTYIYISKEMRSVILLPIYIYICICWIFIFGSSQHNQQ